MIKNLVLIIIYASFLEFMITRKISHKSKSEGTSKHTVLLRNSRTHKNHHACAAFFFTNTFLISHLKKNTIMDTILANTTDTMMTRRGSCHAA